jgi:hypothetical protein
MPGEALEQELLARPDLVFVDVTEENVEDIVADCDRPADEAPQVFTLAQSGTADTRPQASAGTGIAAPQKMPVVHAAATFHAEGYERFGREFIESFRRHWPKETKLWIFAEGCEPEGCDRVIVRDLHEDATDLVAFKQRHANNPGARGHFGETYQYMPHLCAARSGPAQRCRHPGEYRCGHRVFPRHADRVSGHADACGR